ncbi:MAG: protein-L-isoaspartate O-methyltransferase [Candidatus Dormibacteraeota bacterium]|nr:protein-L-isoaspartate O-methyltransferase [Candidatus Dormibacteraeota bacterium]
MPPRARQLAYQNRPLAIGWGQTCSQPEMVGVMVAALLPLSGARVLEVGAGSGYMAAVLRAAGALEVVTLELIPELAATARRNLSRAGVGRVEVRCQGGRRGAPDRAPYQAVVISAAATTVPEALLGQVAEGGTVLVPLGGPEEQELVRLRRGGDGEWQREGLGPCRFVPLMD